MEACGGRGDLKYVKKCNTMAKIVFLHGVNGYL
jgi:hypothetical protein